MWTTRKVIRCDQCLKYQPDWDTDHIHLRLLCLMKWIWLHVCGSFCLSLHVQSTRSPNQGALRIAKPIVYRSRMNIVHISPITVGTFGCYVQKQYRIFEWHIRSRHFIGISDTSSVCRHNWWNRRYNMYSHHRANPSARLHDQIPNDKKHRTMHGARCHSTYAIDHQSLTLESERINFRGCESSLADCEVKITDTKFNALQCWSR